MQKQRIWVCKYLLTVECSSSACVVLEDGERFVCRAGSSYNKILSSSFLVFAGREGKGFTALIDGS